MGEETGGEARGRIGFREGRRRRTEAAQWAHHLFARLPELLRFIILGLGSQCLDFSLLC